MKSMIMGLLLALSSTQAFAQYDESLYDDYQVTILSWCDGNRVMTSDSTGNPYEIRNCDDHAQTCNTYDTYTRWGVTYSAMCEAPKN